MFYLFGLIVPVVYFGKNGFDASERLLKDIPDPILVSEKGLMDLCLRGESNFNI